MSKPLQIEQGLRITRAEGAGVLDEAMLAAVDYRGDVTIERGGVTVTGYLFDFRAGESLRVMAAESGEKISVSVSEVDAIEFSGKDAASGKTWENWVRRYVERKLAGKSANIESESLD